MATDTVGIMSGAFFVGKRELLDWLNEVFEADCTKVEQCASAAIYCQVLDSIFPGKVPLHRVNFHAKFDYEFVNNWKIVQKVFDAQGVKKHIDVQKLVKAKYQDNLEFLQWMKNFWDVKYGGQEYPARERREEAISRYNKGKRFPGKKIARPSGVGGGRPSARPTEAKRASGTGVPRGAGRASGGAARRTGGAARPARRSGGAGGAGGAASGGGAPDPELEAKHQAKLEELNEKLAKLRLTIEGLEKERNFYFGKLRKIEVMCQTEEDVDTATKAAILEVLYATDDAGEFAAPDEDEDAPADEEEVDVDADDADDVDADDVPDDAGDDEDLTF